MKPAEEFTETRTAEAPANERAFATWASSYDAQLSPLLMLEERYLTRVLPNVAGRDVLDAGCGTGRWLRRLEETRPASLTGIDASREMIETAKGKCSGARLIVCPCEGTPFAAQSFDLILSSFVLSYADLRKFAAETSRVARVGCDLFVTDMHPDTQQALGWKRSFAGENGEIVLDAQRHDLTEILRVFEEFGWTVCVALEPGFGEVERAVFDRVGRLRRFDEAAGYPAIYIVHLWKQERVTVIVANTKEQVRGVPGCKLRGGRCALGPEEAQRASVLVADGRIAFLNGERSCPVEDEDSTHVSFDLSGYLLLPGLVNAHDHLEFGLFPRLASRRYESADEWASDIHERYAEEIATQRKVPLRTRLWWGGLRNLLCGATTVCHHNPLLPELVSEEFPVRVVQRYGWAHSVRFGGDIAAAYAATPDDAPFLIHACEGTSAEARAELMVLGRLGVLDERTVLIHGVALNEDDADLLHRRGCSLVVCPSSNAFLFDQVPGRVLLDDLGAVALGSDSPLTACGDLLDEVRFAFQHCDLSASRLYRMVTDSAASVLRLRQGEGTLKYDVRADLVAIRDDGRSPAQRLNALSARDVELVMWSGEVYLVSREMYERLPPSSRTGLEPLMIGDSLRWLRAPVAELVEDAERVLGKGELKLSGRAIRLPTNYEFSV